MKDQLMKVQRIKKRGGLSQESREVKVVKQSGRLATGRPRAAQLEQLYVYVCVCVVHVVHCCVCMLCVYAVCLVTNQRWVTRSPPKLP